MTITHNQQSLNQSSAMTITQKQHYNDLTAISLESWLVREIISKWPHFRLVKYYNLPRSIIINDHHS